MSRISVKDAANQLGLSEDSVLRRIHDKRLMRNRDNKGKWWVLLGEDGTAPTAEADAELCAVRSSAVPPHAAESAESERAVLVSLADVRAMLGEQAERHNEVITALRASHEAAMDRLQRQHQNMVGLVQERADEAAVRAERAERLLVRVLSEQSRRRWWQFW